MLEPRPTLPPPEVMLVGDESDESPINVLLNPLLIEYPAFAPNTLLFPPAVVLKPLLYRAFIPKALL